MEEFVSGLLHKVHFLVTILEYNLEFTTAGFSCATLSKSELYHKSSFVTIGQAGHSAASPMIA